MVEMNEQVLDNLDRIITSLETGQDPTGDTGTSSARWQLPAPDHSSPTAQPADQGESRSGFGIRTRQGSRSASNPSPGKRASPDPGYTASQTCAPRSTSSAPQPAPPPTSVPARQRASDASLRSRLQAANERVRILSAENNELREQLAPVLGELRSLR
ncbi:hypothetical protein [Actinomadura xylanilytica]|uniref:hypothetical protein n=1 Tax=Actinomadura xylanilytica TaxID=887459 RepID=UPI00255B0EC9|nr:hypothetical protein [Actinomadura xylanilytica]MDL4773099.1 hypothetical protein [Actinomadura xylanilytica]